jgi:uncharacterized membrane protein
MKQNSQYRQEGRSLTKGKILNIFLISLVFSVAVGLISSVGSAFAPQIDWETMTVISEGVPGLDLLFSVLVFVLGTYVTYNLTKVFIQVTKNENPQIEESLIVAFKEQPVKAPLLGFIEGIFLSLWTLLLIVPGFVKTYSYALSTFILVNEPDIDAVAAITKSRQLMDGKKLQLFLLDLSYIGWYVLSLFTFGILTIWVASWHQTARTLFFQDAYKA